MRCGFGRSTIIGELSRGRDAKKSPVVEQVIVSALHPTTAAYRYLALVIVKYFESGNDSNRSEWTMQP
jgi:hypothetical protein